MINLIFKNRLSHFCRISELQFTGGQCGSCCGGTSYLQVQWEVTCVDKKEGFIVSRPIPNALETATVVHEEAQVASCSQQGMWKRPRGLFRCVCLAACPAEAGGGLEILCPQICLRSRQFLGKPSHMPVSIRGGSGVHLAEASTADSRARAQSISHNWLCHCLSHQCPGCTMRFSHTLRLQLSSSLDSPGLKLPTIPAVFLAFSSSPSFFSASAVSFVERDPTHSHP